MALVDSPGILRRLGSIVGKQHVSAELRVRELHSQDALGEPSLPAVVVWPRTTQEVAEIVRLANQEGIPVTPRAGGVGYTGGAVPVHGGILLSVARMNEILEIDEANMIARVEPGVITGDFQRAVEARGLFYPPDPASSDRSMLGGNIAENAGGPRCVKYGVTGAYVLGLTFVTGAGAIVRSGGRTTKNVVGFDLTSLMVGSEGLLGVVTEATLRLLRLPESHRTLTALFADSRTAAAAVTGVMSIGIVPAKVEFVDGFTMRAAARETGGPQRSESEALLLIEVDGKTSQVEADAGSIAAVCYECGASEVRVAASIDEAEGIWAMRRTMSAAVGRLRPRKLNQDVVVPRTRIPELLARVAKIARESDLLIPCFGHAGDGNIHTNLMVDNYDDPAVRDRAHAALDILFAWVLEHGGAITGEHGVGLAKLRWLADALGGTSLAVHRAIKYALDPHAVLNPGKMVG
jgi:glycolate oxidase subunit GlcD